MNADEIRTVVDMAALAPSVHNTQPWRFVATGHTLELRADRSRQLGCVDATSRQLHVSCGAALEVARLAVRALGYTCTVRLLPRPDDPELLATLTVGPWHPPTAHEQQLAEAVPRRYTDRGPYDGRPLAPDVLTRMRDAVAERGCWLRPLDRPGERTRAAVLLSEAEGVELADDAYRAELARWARDHPARDGVPSAAAAPWAPGRVSDVPLRDFTGSGIDPRPGAETPPRVERDTLVLIGTDTDDPASWLRAGRALASMLLELTVAGLTAQPLGPVTDLPHTRTALQRTLGLIGAPQMLLRVGRGSGRPRAGRRAAEDVLRLVPVP
jgi:hypothetical protein